MLFCEIKLKMPELSKKKNFSQIYNWTAALYDSANDEALKDAPQEMKDDRFRNDYVPVSCEGQVRTQCVT